jgi:ketose-bisphosphate aldolase
MRGTLAELIREAAGRGSAVAAFTCYNLEAAVGVLAAAERRRAGVVLLVSPGSFRGPEGPLLVAALGAVAERVPVPACVQLDHADDLALMERAFEAGVDAAMADGSKLEFAENADFVRRAAELAARYGAHVEAELGRIEGDEDVARAAAAGALTDPQEAAAFVERTGTTCLAVSIGNVHGRYSAPPRLDWVRLGEIRRRVDVPLALHGTSGLPDEDVRRAISLGVAKFNVNTEMREAYLAATAERLPSVRAGADVLALNRSQADAVARVAEARLELTS